VPSDERDHRDADDDVEHGVEARGGAARKKRHEPELNRVGGDGDDPRGEDSAPGGAHQGLRRSGHGATIARPDPGGRRWRASATIWRSRTMPGP
jgi:hypothetical protein